MFSARVNLLQSPLPRQTSLVDVGQQLYSRNIKGNSFFFPLAEELLCNALQLSQRNHSHRRHFLVENSIGKVKITGRYYRNAIELNIAST